MGTSSPIEERPNPSDGTAVPVSSSSAAAFANNPSITTSLPTDTDPTDLPSDGSSTEVPNKPPSGSPSHISNGSDGISENPSLTDPPTTKNPTTIPTSGQTESPAKTASTTPTLSSGPSSTILTSELPDLITSESLSIDGKSLASMEGEPPSSSGATAPG